VAAAASCTSSSGRRPVASAATTLGRQAGLPLVAGGSSEGIRVGDPRVVPEGYPVEDRVGRPLVLAASSTTGGGGGRGAVGGGLGPRGGGGGGLVGGLPGVEGGCAKGVRVAGPLVDEAGSTDGGPRRRLEDDDDRRCRRVDDHVGSPDGRGRRQV